MVMIEERALIIDASVFGELRSEVSKAVKNKLKIVISEGGKLEKELRKAKPERFSEYKRTLRFYDEICNECVEEKIEQLELVDREAINRKTTRLLRSNDSHVIALAIISGANVLVTADQDLQEDFGKCNSIDNRANREKRNGFKRNNLQPDRKVITQKTPEKPVETSSAVANRLIRSAKIKYQPCECQENQ